jgi:hypothetical protein
MVRSMANASCLSRTLAACITGTTAPLPEQLCCTLCVPRLLDAMAGLRWVRGLTVDPLSEIALAWPWTCARGPIPATD